MTVGSPPMRELYLLFQLTHLAVGNHHKLLIGGRIQEEGITAVSKQLLQLHGHTNGMGGDVEIEIIRKQRIKLHTHQTAFGLQGTMTLDNREETFRGIASRKDNSLSAKGTHLRTADIECVAMGSEPRQGDIIGGRSQRITQTGAIDIKLKAILLTGGI